MQSFRISELPGNITRFGPRFIDLLDLGEGIFARRVDIIILPCYVNGALQFTSSIADDEAWMHVGFDNRKLVEGMDMTDECVFQIEVNHVVGLVIILVLFATLDMNRDLLHQMVHNQSIAVRRSMLDVIISHSKNERGKSQTTYVLERRKICTFCLHCMIFVDDSLFWN